MCPQIYCDMDIDGGGWTLVWQHTYMKFNPLHSKMFYYSNSYRPCVKDASHEDWCNVPHKANFNPTEQMIVAYHKGTIVFAYKGHFNRNIDYHWTGAILLDAKKVIDKCTQKMEFHLHLVYIFLGYLALILINIHLPIIIIIATPTINHLR